SEPAARTTNKRQNALAAEPHDGKESKNGGGAAITSTNSHDQAEGDVGSVVNGHTTIESFASNRSSWTMTAGRGLPASAAPPASGHISPRFLFSFQQTTRATTPWP